MTTSEQVMRARRWLHRYTSTACLHHGAIEARVRCRRTCKFCGAACRCFCHDARWWRHPWRGLLMWVRVLLNERAC